MAECVAKVKPPRLAKILMETTEIRLSVSEAAKFFGVSQRTIRRAITDKEVEFIVVQNRYKIDLASLLNWASKTTTVRHKLAKDGFGQFVNSWKIPTEG